MRESARSGGPPDRRRDVVPRESAAAPGLSPACARRLTAAVFAATLCFYAALNNREVCFGDYPELMAAAARLGVAHPSGYPLWTLLGKLASLLPLGPLPYRLGLVADVCGALCAACLCRVALEARCSPAAAVAAAFAFALSPVAWKYGTLFKGYLLNALLVAAALLLCARVWERDERDRAARDRDLFRLAVVLGLGLSHHLTFLAVPPAVGWAAWRGRRVYVPARGAVGRAVAGLALGCSPWLYFVARAWFPYDRFTCWVHLDGLGSILRLITARQYGSHPFAFSPSAVPLLAARDGLAFWQQFGLLLALVPFGWLALRRRHPALLDIVLGVLAVNGLLVFGAHGGYTDFYLPSYAACAVLIAAALDRRRVLVVAAMVVLAASLPGRYRDLRPSRAPLVMNYVDRIERELPPNAVLIGHMFWGNGDQVYFPIRYAKAVAGRLTGIWYAHDDDLSHARPLAECLREIGVSDQLTRQVLAAPESTRLETLVRGYDGSRPLYTDSPVVFEAAGKGGACRGFFWRIVDQPGCTLESDSAQDLAWVDGQLALAERCGHDQAAQEQILVSALLLNQVHYYWASGRPDEARRAAVGLSRRCGRAAAALSFAASYLARLGCRQDAWDVWRRLQRDAPYDASTWLARAFVEVQEGSLREALESLGTAGALDRAQNPQQVAYLKAMCYLQLGQPARAEREAGPVIWASIQRDLRERRGGK